MPEVTRTRQWRSRNPDLGNDIPSHCAHCYTHHTSFLSLYLPPSSFPSILPSYFVFHRELRHHAIAQAVSQIKVTELQALQCVPGWLKFKTINVPGQRNTALKELQLTSQPGGDSQRPPPTSSKLQARCVPLTTRGQSEQSPQALPGMRRARRTTSAGAASPPRWPTKGIGRQFYQSGDMFPD